MIMIIFYKIISLEQSKAFNKITKLKKKLEILYNEIELIELDIEDRESEEHHDLCNKEIFFYQRLILIKEYIDLKNQTNHIKKKLERIQLEQASKETLEQFPGLQWTLLLHRVTKNKSESDSDSLEYIPFSISILILFIIKLHNLSLQLETC